MVVPYIKIEPQLFMFSKWKHAQKHKAKHSPLREKANKILLNCIHNNITFRSLSLHSVTF